MGEETKTQELGRRRLRIHFIFRLAPGFFVVLVPVRRFLMAEDYYDEETVVIRRVTETEYMFLRRCGVHEAGMMTEPYEQAGF